MRVVAFVSEMPGSGKTVLAGHVAAQAEAEGVGPVVVLDGDPARGLSDWWAERAAPSPILGAWDRTCTAEGFKRLAKGGVQLVVIDTPSGHTAMAEQAIALADLVVLPTRPNPRDLEVAGAVVDMVEALGTPFVFLINHTQGEDDFPTAAVIALAQHGTVCPVILPQRSDFNRCRAGGRTVMELDPDSPSSEDMARLWDYLSDHMVKVAPAAKAKRRSAPGDRRRFPRHRYDQIATYSVGDMVFPCHIADISAGGVSILTAEPPVEGTEVTLHVPYLGAFKAESVYVAADRVGLRFLIDEQTQGDLVKQLSAFLHSDQRRREAESPEPGEPESLPRTATG
ncbi:MAG: PilZ domain-containing protein [Proteobacteria bacterium]|nr:PilZ domain-containing protein [Pseudomonadota bacterium]